MASQEPNLEQGALLESGEQAVVSSGGMWRFVLPVSVVAGGFGGGLLATMGQRAVTPSVAWGHAPEIDNSSLDLMKPVSCSCLKCDGLPDPDATSCAARNSDAGQACVSSLSGGCYSTLAEYDCNCSTSSPMGEKTSTGVPTTCSCMVCGFFKAGSWTSGSCAAGASPAGQACRKDPQASGCVSSLDDYGCNCPGTVGGSIKAARISTAKKDAAAREVYKKDHCGTSGNNEGAAIGGPMYTASACACSALCANTVGCQGWTYAPGYGVLNSTGGLNSCFLRSSWGAMIDNCGSTPCYSAPVDPCGMPWNFAAKQQTTVSTNSSCECAAACDKVEECDAWTYYYNYNSGKDNCWIMNAAGDGTNSGCVDECFAGQKLRAKCGALGKGLAFDSWSSVQMYTLTADDPCTCEKECLKSDGECKAWTYELGGTGGMNEAKDNKCILYSGVEYTKSSSTCISDTLPAWAPLIHDLEQVKNDYEGAQSQAALEKTVCSQITNETGNFTYIASPDFADVEDWPALDPTAYKALSQLLTTVAAVNITLSDDVRSTYPFVIGTAVVGSYSMTLLNDLALEAARAKAGVDAKEWGEAVAQLLEEVQYLELVGAWFDTYSGLFALVGDQVFEAFTTTAALVSMPGTTQVAGTKVHGWKIALKCLKVVISVSAIIATDGGYAAAKGAEKATADAAKAAKDAEAGVEGAEDAEKAAKLAGEGYKAATETYKKISLIGTNIKFAMSAVHVGRETANIAPATAGGQNPEAASDATTASYYDLIANVQDMLNSIAKSITGQKMILAGNYGRLQAAAAAAGACPISDNELQAIVTETYGGMQWLALGQLLPTKYAIYLQRDYMGGRGPNCYYNNCGGGTSDDQCGSSSSTVLGCEGTTMGCYEPSISPYDKCGVKGGGVEWPAKRFLWMGQQNNPSEVPSEAMWDALSDGPISTFINKRHKTAYTGSYGAFEAFMTQCAYVSKVYIPGGSITYSETQVSAVSVDCDVYGITIPVFSFMDCGTQVTSHDVAWNGVGINSDGTSGDGTGNFNQMTYIPNKPGSWATYKDGQVGCCLPWKGSVSLPNGCDYILCDCFSMAVMGNGGAVNGNNDGQWSDSPSGTWWNMCQVVTDSPSFKQYIQTSFGPEGPWQRIITSGNDYSSMQGLEDVALT